MSIRPATNAVTVYAADFGDHTAQRRSTTVLRYAAIVRQYRDGALDLHYTFFAPTFDEARRAAAANAEKYNAEAGIRALYFDEVITREVGEVILVDAQN